MNKPYFDGHFLDGIDFRPLKTAYILKREDGIILDIFLDKGIAEDTIKEYEREDRTWGQYTDNFYSIEEVRVVRG